MTRERILPIIAAGLMALAGLTALWAKQLWPLAAMSIVLTLALRFRLSTAAIGRVTEVLAVALVAIVVLDGLGVNIIFVYKSAIALLLFAIVMLERDGLLKIHIRRGRFFEHGRLCSLVALIGMAVVAVGHFIYRGPSPSIGHIPGELLILTGVGWAVLNTASEEIIYRGLLMSRLEAVAGKWTAILLQAVVFAIAHFWTIVPVGPFGILLSFLFAIALGWLVQKTRSLSASLFVHFWVDLALFVTVLVRQ